MARGGDKMRNGVTLKGYPYLSPRTSRAHRCQLTRSVRRHRPLFSLIHMTCPRSTLRTRRIMPPTRMRS
jgi:hypothetical protein